MDWVHIVFLSIFVAVGLCMFVWGIRCVVRSRQAASWPVVEGAMNSCEVKSFENDGTTMWEVVVNYSYRVSGREYQGTQIAFGYSGSNCQKEHTALYDKLAKARTLAVRYNPSNPSQVVLSWSLGTTSVVLVLMGMLFLAGPISLEVRWCQDSAIVFWGMFLFPIVAFGLYFACEGNLVKAMIDRIEIQEAKVANKAPEDTARKLADPQP